MRADGGVLSSVAGTRRRRGVNLDGSVHCRPGSWPAEPSTVGPGRGRSQRPPASGLRNGTNSSPDFCPASEAASLRGTRRRILPLWGARSLLGGRAGVEAAGRPSRLGALLRSLHEPARDGHQAPGSFVLGEWGLYFLELTRRPVWTRSSLRGHIQGANSRAALPRPRGAGTVPPSLHLTKRSCLLACVSGALSFDSYTLVPAADREL